MKLFVVHKMERQNIQNNDHVAATELPQLLSQNTNIFGEATAQTTSGYAIWFTAGGAIRIAHYDVIDDVITRKL